MFIPRAGMLWQGFGPDAGEEALGLALLLQGVRAAVTRIASHPWTPELTALATGILGPENRSHRFQFLISADSRAREPILTAAIATGHLRSPDWRWGLPGLQLPHSSKLTEETPVISPYPPPRRVVTWLMSPSDLGELLRPFVFLDLSTMRRRRYSTHAWAGCSIADRATKTLLKRKDRSASSARSQPSVPADCHGR